MTKKEMAGVAWEFESLYILLQFGNKRPDWLDGESGYERAIKVAANLRDSYLNKVRRTK